MINYILASLLLLIAIMAMAIRKAYFSTPITEMQRRAQHGESLSARLYQSVVYDGSLSLLLWLIITISAASGMVLLARQTSVWISILAVVFFLWVAFLWLPSSRVTAVGYRMAVAVSPSLSWLLNYLHPVLSHGWLIAKKRSAKLHTGLYETSDLLELIERQQLQPDNRLAPNELDIAKLALSFSQLKVSDVMTSRKVIKIINADDTVGPILIDELHKSGQPVALVRETAKGPIIGSLELKVLNLTSNGKVRDIMDKTICYVNESDSLTDVLQAFFATNQPLFIAVNNIGEIIGVITVKTVLEKLLGQIPSDDFDQYSSIDAVAARHDKPKTPKTDDDIDETVEI